MDSKKIEDVLPEDVLTLDPKKWRTPTSEEFRAMKAVAGVPNGRMAHLIGVTIAMIVRYQSVYRLKNKCNITFANWHLLLHRLGLKKI